MKRITKHEEKIILQVIEKRLTKSAAAIKLDLTENGLAIRGFNYLIANYPKWKATT